MAESCDQKWHFNESIVNEEILEDMKKNRIDHMKYLPGMETVGRIRCDGQGHYCNESL